MHRMHYSIVLHAVPQPECTVQCTSRTVRTVLYGIHIIRSGVVRTVQV